MRALRLNSDVKIAGTDFFGRESKLFFKQNPFCNLTPAFYILFPGCFKLITSNDVLLKKRRLQLSVNNFALEIFEHIGVLKYAGISNVLIDSLGYKWPPYYGRSLEFFNAIKPFLTDTNRNVPFYTVSKPVEWSYSNHRGYLQISPSHDLKINIISDFKGVGRKDDYFCLIQDSFLNNGLFKKILGAYTLGWPPSLYRFSQFLFWHSDKITWPQNYSACDFLSIANLHRAQDLLGALSLLGEDGLFVGEVESYCAGHEADINAVKLANQCLVQVGHRNVELKAV